ncbi:calcium/proton exchanger [Colletotrichum costaricense]|uniref:Calcium/proton exchanger n=2 Tax=Colletotrichum acutatum species complex TaxID=2707335 RepID=A0AAI9YEM9_9PEZI|nr:calcium/proton exchanger [Colletotrichum costaricense]XP_060374244.1 calcium/proton exchanger [Colletotrichum tamarilloi]KAK1477443.1 calcium/proton exchanger [Colletotrichum tamarilloi]KAK1504332.1 calcium/proton exchanger [Colletotrichum costaricense]
MLVNVFWTLLSIAFVLQFLPGLQLSKFATAYDVAVVLLASILGFAGQDFAWKMSQVAGLLNETTFGFLVEIIPFIVPILKHETSVPRESSDENNLIPVIQAPILGSILTNLLLCLRSCFFFLLRGGPP